MKDILTVFKEASFAAKHHPETINATVGVFLNDDHLLTNAQVDLALSHVNSHMIAPYLGVDGESMFKKQIEKWAFKSYLEDIKHTFLISTTATLGGSGGIDMVFSFYGEDNDDVLLPDITWEYLPFLDKAKKKAFYYTFFKEGHFNVEGFEKALEVMAAKQKNLIVVINDPCHNPTGYTLSKQEIQKIFHILNRFIDHQICVLYDLAYFDFSQVYEDRSIFNELKQLEKHVQIFLVLSGSKSFGLYGTRIGATICLSHHIEAIHYFERSVYRHVVGSYSAPVTIGVRLVEQILESGYLPKDIENVLNKRRSLFLQEANQVGLKLHPTNEGFYVLIMTEDPEKSYENLKKKSIFLVPMEKGLRLSLGSISEQQIKGLAQLILEAL